MIPQNTSYITLNNEYNDTVVRYNTINKRKRTNCFCFRKIISTHFDRNLSHVLYFSSKKTAFRNPFVRKFVLFKNDYCFARRKRENRAQRQLQPFRKVHASVLRRELDDQRVHNSRLLVGTVEDHVPKSRRTELSRVLSASRGREGKYACRIGPTRSPHAMRFLFFVSRAF